MRAIVYHRYGPPNVVAIVVDQSILGRLLGYGSIVVRGTGSGIEGLHHIADPLSLRSSIVVR